MHGIFCIKFSYLVRFDKNILLYLKVTKELIELQMKIDKDHVHLSLDGAN
jgi:hypothetical protein